MITLRTIYAQEDDITFIMETIDTKTEIIERIIGWYYGEPDEKLTEEHAYDNLAAVFPKE